MSYFRVTVVDLDTGDTQAMDVAAGDYLLIPFAPCHLHSTQKHFNGTTQLVLHDHRPTGPPRPVDVRPQDHVGGDAAQENTR